MLWDFHSPYMMVGLGCRLLIERKIFIAYSISKLYPNKYMAPETIFSKIHNEASLKYCNNISNRKNLMKRILTN